MASQREEPAPGGERRQAERRRLLDLTRREKGLPERRLVGVDRRWGSVLRRAAGSAPRPAGVQTRRVLVTLVLGDITEQRVDAIVNAANGALLGGGGVDGAIHRRGGPAILEACRGLRRTRLRAGLPPGQAVATTAGNLPATWVIHTVGPVWSPDEDRSGLLASAHRESLRVAEELGARTVAVPSVSTGVYGYPVDDAASTAVTAVLAHPAKAVREVRFVLFDWSTYAAYERALAAAGPLER